MLKYLVAVALVLPSVACSKGAETVQFHSSLNGFLQPGQAGTLVQLADADHEIVEIALSDNYLYFTIPWGGLYQIPKYGGDARAVDEGSNVNFWNVATAGGSVFWDHTTFDDRDYPHTRINARAQDRADGNETTTLVAGDFGIAEASAFKSFQSAGGYLYWEYDTGGGTPLVIDRVPVGGGPRETVWTATVAIYDFPSWVADDEGIYMTNTGRFGGGSDCKVEIIRTPGAAPEAIAACPTADSIVVATDPDAIYLQSTQALWKMAKQGGSVSAIVTFGNGSGIGYPIADGGTNLYGYGSLNPVVVSKAGGPVTQLDTGGLCQHGIGEIVVDVAYVYLLCGYDSIVAVPKPAAP